MAAWVMQKALVILDRHWKKSREKGVAQGTLILKMKIWKLWKDISRKMYVPFLDEMLFRSLKDNDQTEEFPWEEYPKQIR